MKAANDQNLAIPSERRLFDQVYNRLRSAIVTGQFEPGARLVERDLTAKLQVSRTPIREALTHLERDGLVVCAPHRSYHVRKPFLEEARQAYEVRRALEGLAAELAATRATRDETQSLRQIVRDGYAALSRSDYPSLLLLNNDLHQSVVTAAHNWFLDQQFRSIWAYVDLLRGRWWAGTPRPDTGHPEHEALVEAIAAHDGVGARRIAEEHVGLAWANIAHRFDGQDPSQVTAGDNRPPSTAVHPPGTLR